MTEQDIDYLAKRMEEGGSLFISPVLNENEQRKAKQIEMLTDSFYEMLVDLCGDDMPSILDVQNNLKQACYHAKMALSQSPKK